MVLFGLLEFVWPTQLCTKCACFFILIEPGLWNPPWFECFWSCATGCSLRTDICNIPFIFYIIHFLALFLWFLSSIYRAVLLLSGKTCQIQIITVQKLGHLTDQILKMCKVHRKLRIKQTSVLFCKYLRKQSSDLYEIWDLSS